MKSKATNPPFFVVIRSPISTINPRLIAWADFLPLTYSALPIIFVTIATFSPASTKETNEKNKIAIIFAVFHQLLTTLIF